MAQVPNRVDIPDDTRSIHKIGAYIMQYDVLQNAFLDALINRVGRVLLTSRLWDDPWATFEKGTLEFGETTEEIFANIAKPFSYDPAKAESELYKRETPDVRAAFHTMNWQKFYKVTVSEPQLRQAFLSYSELDSLIGKIVESLYTSMNLDNFLGKKYMLCRELVNGGIYSVVTAAIDTDPDDAIIKYREYTNNLKFLKTIYNRAHVRNSTPIEEQVIIIPNDVEATLGVKVLADAFNLSEVDYISQRIPIDSFEFDEDDKARLAELFEKDDTYAEFTDDEVAALQKISAVKLDRNWFMCYDNFERMGSVENIQGLYWNYILHKWRTISASPFANAIAFTEQDTSITAVTVSPSTGTVAQGSRTIMSADVTGSGLYEKTVTWSISGATSSGTKIGPDTGVLTVAKDETEGSTITVTATAVDGKSGTASLTVSAASTTSTASVKKAAKKTV